MEKKEKCNEYMSNDLRLAIKYKLYKRIYIYIYLYAYCIFICIYIYTHTYIYIHTWMYKEEKEKIFVHFHWLLEISSPFLRFSQKFWNLTKKKLSKRRKKKRRKTNIGIILFKNRKIIILFCWIYQSGIPMKTT